MRVIEDNIWLCQDCTQVACNGLYGIEISEQQATATVHGLSKLGAHLVPDFDSDTRVGIRECSGRACQACQTVLTGYRARFAMLGADSSVRFDNVNLSRQ
jgi:hypothetical protein